MTSSPAHCSRMLPTRGSSLIECLVAMAVFAIGSAANATWMMQSMATHARASRLVAAVSIAASLEARMRRNRDAALARRYDDRAHARRVDCSAGCDEDDIAALDLHVFERAMAMHIGPMASGAVRCDDGLCAIDIAWRHSVFVHWRFRP